MCQDGERFDRARPLGLRGVAPVGDVAVLETVVIGHVAHFKIPLLTLEVSTEEVVHALTQPSAKGNRGAGVETASLRLHAPRGVSANPLQRGVAASSLSVPLVPTQNRQVEYVGGVLRGNFQVVVSPLPPGYGAAIALPRHAAGVGRPPAHVADGSDAGELYAGHGNPRECLAYLLEEEPRVLVTHDGGLDVGHGEAGRVEHEHLRRSGGRGGDSSETHLHVHGQVDQTEVGRPLQRERHEACLEVDVGVPNGNRGADLGTPEGEDVWHVDDEAVVRLGVGSLPDAEVEGGRGGEVVRVVRRARVHQHHDLAEVRAEREGGTNIGRRAGEVVGGQLPQVSLQPVGVLRHELGLEVSSVWPVSATEASY